MSAKLDRELNVRFIVGFAVVLTVVTVGMAALMWTTSSFLSDRLEAQDPPPPKLPSARVQQKPPGPQLQADPERELDEMRLEEERQLSSYEWIDQGGGIARVPISRAIELAAGSVRADGEPTETTPEGDS